MRTGFICLMTLISFMAAPAAAQETWPAPEAIIGKAFGRDITAREFAYYYITAAIFTRTGKSERSEEETRLEAWQNLIYRHAAEEDGVSISTDELKKELERLMAEKDIIYGTEEYYNWVRDEMKEDVATFERRIQDLLIINKFIEKKTNPETEGVTEEDIKQKFLNQYNSFESEYIRFENEDEAKEFLKKVKENPKLWKETYEEKKPMGQKGAAWINIMSLEALIDLWQIPSDDAYNILGHKEGDFIAAKFYYGDAVFRLLRKREADMPKLTDKKKQYYRDMLTDRRKRKIVKDYFEDLLKRADYKDYVAEEEQRRKIEELKTKSLVALETNRGIIELRLFPDIAPFACENFIGLVENGYYDGVIFHRVIKDFMIQGGDPTGTGSGGDSIWKQPFVDEVSDEVLFDKPGLLAMANAGANTNKSQFFITVKATPHLNKKHTIFGEVVSGYDVVKKINTASTDSKDKPKEEQKIIKAYIKSNTKKSPNIEKRGGKE